MLVASCGRSVINHEVHAEPVDRVNSDAHGAVLIGLEGDSGTARRLAERHATTPAAAAVAEAHRELHRRVDEVPEHTDHCPVLLRLLEGGDPNVGMRFGGQGLRAAEQQTNE